MSRSWNHYIRKLSEGELAGMRRRADDSERWAAEHPNFQRSERYRRFEEQCRSAKCMELAVYLAAYDYVTGRKGRVSYRCRFLCEAHGQRFATKYKLPIQEADSGTHRYGAETREKEEAPS
jgi:hypothetical protein